eukprot:CAMPEP_0196571640 /NCGR_PEP_ID=MMETSP1081-20130531/1787_1 /TAXON_ID=36882 /ORGANISM="Pyramimonas amylifera, Strain CCMP720" /LENGTH=245 /DNA_ID=CAMNT_0041888661 /DNA_START=152 /DNA_END=889 /DNA_ORIENTATION=-
MNNNSSAERALQAGCAGVFSTHSYVTVGDPGKPLLYGVRQKERSTFGGKQMMTNPGKQGELPERYFDKKFTWISDGDKFNDRTTYANTQKEKKKGFLTGDFKRRDEFANITRTEQYRELLKMEDKHRKTLIAMSDFHEEDPELKAKLDREAKTKNERGKSSQLYDLVYEKDNDAQSFAKQQQNARDTKNPTQLGKERDFGTYQTSSMSFGYGVEECEHEKPMYARLPIVQSTFYRPAKIPMNSLP